MAVPKRKTSKSKRNMRRSHDSLKEINIIIDKNSGEPRLSHTIDLSTGIYLVEIIINDVRFIKNLVISIKVVYFHVVDVVC